MSVLKRLGLTLLMSMALVLAAAPLTARAGDEPDWASCEMCKHVLEDMELVMACDYDISDWSQGLVFNLSLKNPELMPRFRTMEERDKSLAEKFKSMSAGDREGRICSMCARYLAFLDKGLKEERVETPAGTVMVSMSENSALVKELHAWAADVREAMASFDMELAAGAGGCSGDCGGDCPSCAAAKAKKAAECSGDCGGNCAACAAKAAGCSGDCGGTCPTCAAAKKAAAKIPEFMLEEMKKCHLCSTYADDPGIMTAAKMNVVLLKNGFVINNTVLDKKNLDRYQEFEKKFHAKVDDLEKQGSWDDAMTKVCQMCRQFCELEHEGAVMDWSPTTTGTMSIVMGKDPKLVQKILNMGKMLKAYENMEMFPEEEGE